jgi:peptide/nickel transport system substrate-binding protein
MRKHVLTALTVPVVFALVAAACGSDSGSSDAETGDGTNGVVTTEDAGNEDSSDTTASEADGDVDTSIVAETEPAAYGDTLLIGLEAEATGLRPWEDACGEPCVNISRAIFDPLVQQNVDGVYEGYLAESVEPNDDFTEWTLTLRPGVTFHNGEPLTAQTIVDMYAVQQSGSTASGRIATVGLTGVEATGELTVVYTLDASNSAFPSNLNTVELGYVFEPAAASADPAGFSKAPVGTGPFAIQNRDIDNETTVVRNENYWRTDADGNQLPYLDSIVFRPIPDEGTRLDALLSGTVDVIESRRQATIRDTRAESGITMYEYQGNSTGGGMYNTAVPPFDDVRVRVGLNTLNDRVHVIEALGGSGISLPVSQWFSKDSPWWTQAAEDAYADFDFEAGKALLQEYIDDPARSDGKAPGEKIDVELSCPPDPTLVAAMQVNQQTWTGSGLVNVNLTQFDQATHINNAVSDQHQASCWRWGTQADPSTALNTFLADPAESVGNFPNWFDPEAFGWALDAIQTDDFEARKELYSKIMVRINEQAPVWYSGGTATLIATNETVRGVNNWTLPSGALGNGTPGAVTYFTQAFVTGR